MKNSEYEDKTYDIFLQTRKQRGNEIEIMRKKRQLEDEFRIWIIGVPEITLSNIWVVGVPEKREKMKRMNVNKWTVRKLEVWEKLRNSEKVIVEDDSNTAEQCLRV